MSLPEPLKDFIDGVLSNIKRADNLNISTTAGTAETLLRTAKSYVVPAPALNAAFDDAIERIADFHEEVVDQNTLIRKVTPAIENARGMAMVEIERLARALWEARPSDEAIAIGLEWF